MISRKEIEKDGYNPNYIKRLGEAIVEEASNEYMSFDYVREKIGEIERFIKEIEKDKEKKRRDGRRE